MMENCFIVGIGMEDHEYCINGVRYVVSARYALTERVVDDEPTLSNKLRSYIGGDFADLTIQAADDNVNDVPHGTMSEPTPWRRS